MKSATVDTMRSRYEHQGLVSSVWFRQHGQDFIAQK